MMNNQQNILLKKGEIEKRIWGHRLYNEQTGIMTFLEFLCVFENRPFAEQVSSPSDPLNDTNARLGTYNAPKRPLLRSLIFNNPYVDEVFTNSENPWKDWCDKFIGDEQNRDIDKDGHLALLQDRLDELKTCFNEGGRISDHESFERFAKVIALLRNSGINLLSDKRWTSRFVFPWGKNCLFLDMSLDGGTGDRRFFARNGELLYMMLSFAALRDELSELLNQKILYAESDLDTLCKLLSFGKENRQCISNKQGEGCVLPLSMFEESRRRINILCEDLIHLFKLPIPTPDIIQHAVRMISLNLLCYFLEQSRSCILKHSPEGTEIWPCIIPCEAIQKQTSDIRNLSKRFFEVNKDLSLNAVRAFYEHYDGRASANALVSLFENDEDYDEYEEYDDDYDGIAAKDSLAAILETHKGHWGPSLHRHLARDCGLSTSLCTTAYRYAPSDELIETLVATIVPIERKRLLFKEVLEIAYDRYGLVFGENEFHQAKITDTTIVPNNSEFEANRFRLAEKLRSLGLLVALSDGFEFVLNPYQA